VARVQAYFDSAGQSLLGEIEAERERLSAALDFEAAAVQHAKAAKIKGILSACDDIYGRLDRVNAVMAQPSSQAKSVELFRFCSRGLSGPLTFAVEAEDESQPMESRIRAALEQLVSDAPHSAQRFTEELAMLKRWYYRSHKVGEVFFAGEHGELPWRRIVRGVARVYREEKEVPVAVPQDPAIEESQ